MIKTKTDVFLLVITILYFISFPINLYFCIVNFSAETLYRTILYGVAGVVFVVIFILSLHDFGRKLYCVSYNHEYYTCQENIFENSNCKKKRLSRVNKHLKGKLNDNFVYRYFNKKLKLKFTVYELNDNFQLLIFKTSVLKRKWYSFDGDDLEKNINPIIEKNGVRDYQFESELGIEHYYTNDKKSLFSIEEFYIENSFAVYEWKYTIKYSYKIEEALNYMGTAWVSNIGERVFDSLAEAREYVLNAVETINSREKLHYFIIYRDCGCTAYHEFQPGQSNYDCWSQSSIFLDEDIMEDSKLEGFFNRIIPNYDYFGRSIVSKETWELLKNEVDKESEIIKEIIQDMTPWAEKSINTFGFFTIIGI